MSDPFDEAWSIAKKKVDERRKRGGIAPEAPFSSAKRSLGSDVLEGHRFSHTEEDTSEFDAAHWMDKPFMSSNHEAVHHDDDDVYEEEAARYEDRERRKAMRRGIKDPRQATISRVNPSSGRPGMTPLPNPMSQQAREEAAKPRTFKEVLAARSASKRGGSPDEPDF